MTRRRAALLAGAGVCLLAVSIFVFLVMQDRSPLDSLDQSGKSGEDWADDHATLIQFLRLVEAVFGTIGMIICAGLLAAILLSRRRVRAAAFTVLVMVATSLTTTALKIWLARGRPDWQDHVDLLSSKSFPSGHASSIAALVGVLLVLVWGLMGNRTVRWPATVFLLVLWFIVCLDRVLLGRHFPSDVVAGSLLGVAVVLIGWAVFDPVSEGRSSDQLVASGR
jgi:membrane-associated phospholipid phosphatase